MANTKAIIFLLALLTFYGGIMSLFTGNTYISSNYLDSAVKESAKVSSDSPAADSQPDSVAGWIGYIFNKVWSAITGVFGFFWGIIKIMFSIMAVIGAAMTDTSSPFSMGFINIVFGLLITLVVIDYVVPVIRGN